MSPESDNPPPERTYLTTREAADQMGLAVATVRALCKRKVLPGAEQDSEQSPWRIPVEDVEDWIATHKQQSWWESLKRVQRWRVIVGLGAVIAVLANIGGATDFLQKIGEAGWQQIATPTAIPTTTPLPTETPLPTLTPSPTATPLAFATSTEDETLILIATFDRADGVNDARPHIKIRDAVRTAAHEMNFSHLRVEVESMVLATDARDEAEILGQRYNASIVIWGEETSVNVTVNFLNRKVPAVVAAETQITETERNFASSFARPDPYSRFINEDLPGQLTFLTLFALGQSYGINEAYTEAASTIERAITSLPSNVQLEGVAGAYFQLGWLYDVPLKDSAKALENYNQAIQRNPNDAQAHNNRGSVYSEQENYAAALADFNQAIKLNPNYVNAYSNRGVVYGKQGNYAAALADLNQAIKLNPNYANAYYNRGNVYYKQGNYDAALADYNQAIQSNPNDAQAYNNRGGVYSEQGDYNAALVDYNQAIELNPNDVEFYNNRGIVYGKQENYEAALADFNQAIKLNPSNAGAHYEPGHCTHYQWQLPSSDRRF